MVEAARGTVNDLQLVTCFNSLKKHFRSFIYEKPAINTDMQAKKKTNSHFWLGVLFMLPIKFQVCLVFKLKTSEDTALKYFVTDFPELS